MRRLLGVILVMFGLAGIISRFAILTASYLLSQDMIPESVGRVIVSFETAESKLIITGWILFGSGLVLIGRSWSRRTLLTIGALGMFMAFLPKLVEILSVFVDNFYTVLLRNITDVYDAKSFNLFLLSIGFLLFATLLLRPKRINKST
ncbi:membrane hypothetical protein [Mesotoga infera]|nr:membrane hypothetical protein [Mesotoga infera]